MERAIRYACFTDSPSIEKIQRPKGCCMELGNWSIKNQLGSTNSKGLPVLFQGSHQGSFLNKQLSSLLLLPTRPAQRLAPSNQPIIHPSAPNVLQVVVLLISLPLSACRPPCHVKFSTNPLIKRTTAVPTATTRLPQKDPPSCSHKQIKDT